MKRNPLVPYFLIFAMGFVLIFFLGIKGIGDAREIANEGEGNGDVVEVDPEAIAQKSCISCHGENLEGKNNAPSLRGMDLTKDEIVDVIMKGRPDKGMPGGLVPAENVEQLADWLASLE